MMKVDAIPYAAIKENIALTAIQTLTDVFTNTLLTLLLIVLFQMEYLLSL